jgi:hypothetical protein
MLVHRPGPSVKALKLKVRPSPVPAPTAYLRNDLFSFWDMARCLWLRCTLIKNTHGGLLYLRQDALSMTRKLEFHRFQVQVVRLAFVRYTPGMPLAVLLCPSVCRENQPSGRSATVVNFPLPPTGTHPPLGPDLADQNLADGWLQWESSRR